MARPDSRIQFDALAIEGGLFTADWLGKIASFGAPMQAEADYGVRAGFALREEIALAWRAAQALWAQFAIARATAGHDAAAVSQRFSSELLKQAFGFSLHAATAPQEADGRLFPIGYFAFDGTVPVVIGSHAATLDESDSYFGDSSGERIRRRSAFGLVQEYLNARNGALWGIAVNGLVLRIARDNSSLTRPAWLEADLERLFTEERFAEFSVLWLVAHATRFGGENVDSVNCVLERWRDACREQGVTARGELRRGVEQALLDLGTGFLAHPENTALRDALANGQLTTRNYFQQLLRLVYRQIFLLTVEERGILHREDSAVGARALYAEGYALRRLRERAVRRNAHDRHHDLWEGLKLVWHGLARGEPRLALPPLGGLFAQTQCPDLDGAKVENRHMLRALYHLAWLRDRNQPNAPLARVNWRDMGPEELGSIYESLLELVPQVDEGSRSFSFLEGDETRGNARKTSGSYYTPDSLVQLLLDSALDPVIAERLAAHPSGEGAIEALLSISVIDPACGSGHFLLAAARRIATNLARVQAEARGSGQPTPSDYRHALRQVVTHCVFGVDMNPMALELARTALWLEAFTPDAPLGFLDHHLACGNALLGVMDPKTLLEGIPDEAYKELTGDNKDLCRDLKKQNKKERDGLERMRKAAAFSQSLGTMDLALTAAPLERLDALPDDSLDQADAKRRRFEELRESRDSEGLSLAMDLYCAAFFLPKQGTATDHKIPTTQDVLRALVGQQVTEEKRDAARQIALEIPLLHWPLVFAQIFARGGFTCVLGNPPWERIKLQEEEFFASRAPEVANARNKVERERGIAQLAAATPGSPERRVHDEFVVAKHVAEAASVFAHGSRYPLTGTGDVNTYALFAETALVLIHQKGRAGLVLPSGIATDDSTSAFFGQVSTGRLVSLVDFENKEGLFEAVHRSTKFCLLTLGFADAANFAFFLTRIEQLADSRRNFMLSPEDISRFNPNTRTCPVFRSQADAEITKKIYQHVPVLWDEASTNGNPWGIQFMGMFHMSNDSGFFRDAARRSDLVDPVPLYEAKMVDLFDHRSASYAGRGDDRGNRVLPATTDLQHQDPMYNVEPYYWVERSLVEERLAGSWRHRWLMGFNDITTTVTERTFLAALFPRAGVGNSMPLFLPLKSPGVGFSAALYANLCALPFDYVARQKVGRLHLNFFIVKQLPVLPPSTFTLPLLNLVVPSVLELCYTAQDLKPFYDDVIAENPAWDPRTLSERGKPFQWNPDRRAFLRAELDAYYARLYGLSRDELRYILDPKDVMGEDYPSETFRVLKDKEIRQFGEYRTRRLVLEAWDRLSDLEISQVSVFGLPQPEGVEAKPIYSAIGVIRNESDARLTGVLLNLVWEAESITLQNVTLAVTMLQEPGRVSLLLNDSEAAQLASFSDSIRPIDETNVTAILAYLENAGVVRREDQGARIKSLPSDVLPSGVLTDRDSTYVATLLLKAIAAREAEMKKTGIGTVEEQETKRRA